MRTRNLFDALKPGRSHKARFCDHAGCVETTREGKPYCPDHVDRHPYVQEVLAQLAERDEQDEKVAAKGSKAAKIESLTVQEILQHLEFHGPRTEERLVRELNVELRVLQGYLSALRQRRIITLGHTKRGSTLVKLCKKVGGPTVPEWQIKESA